MKVVCLQENLSAALSEVGRAVASRTPLPITSNVLISTDNGRLRLSATNLELTITNWIGARVEEEGGGNGAGAAADGVCRVSSVRRSALEPR